MAYLILLCFFSTSGAAQTIRIPQGNNHVLHLPGLTHAAVGNPRIVKVKGLSDDQLLLTAKKVGHTKLWVWKKNRDPDHFALEVLEAATGIALRSIGESTVVRAQIEFMELDESFGREMGIKWPELFEFQGQTTLAGGSFQSGLNYAFSGNTATGIVGFLVHEGWARVLARPELHVRLGEEATFHSGGEFPVLTTQAAQGGHLQKKVDWKTHGISVKVKPQSIDGLYIRASVQIEISEPKANSHGVPSLSRRKIVTKIDAKDGESVILSGLQRDLSSEVKEKTPWFSKLPIFGHLFSKQKKDKPTLS